MSDRAIRRLDSATASKIAAGEVVDKPLNVVKELVENSVDAGATKITVAVEGGGAESIIITDNGAGIAFDELPLAVERFATSKATNVEDVYNISTYGFRGEALAAVSSVSKFKLQSARKGEQGGEIIVDYGKTSTPRPSAISQGTQITVEKIFENLPVRKKFLKSQRSNDAEILRFLKHFAMINAGVELIANIDGREVFRSYPADTILDLAKSAFEEDRMMCGEYERGQIKATVCTTHPAIQRKRRDNILIGVNGRVIRDASLVQAVIQAYHRMIPANAYPSAVVDLRIAPSLVDVNIHPTKSEVRFDSAKAGELFGIVLRATETALNKFTSAIYAETEEELNSDQVETPKATISKAELEERKRTDPFLKTTPLKKYEANMPLSDVSTAYKADKPESSSEPQFADAHKAAPVFDMGKEFEAEKLNPPISGSAPSIAYQAPQFAKSQSAQEAENISKETDAALSFKVVGQLNNTYIVCQSPAGDLVVIDQHVAHERVLYEKYLAEQMKLAPSITLFEPVVINVEPEEAELLEEISGQLAKFGYGYESFGPKEIKITRVPVDKAKKDIAKEFTGIIQDAMDNRRSRTQDYAIVTMSCKNAIKAGDPLSIYEMQHLVDSLFAARNPHTCPHGRPIVFMMPLSELNKKFQR